MQTKCTFSVTGTTPVDYAPEIATAMPVGIMHMVKEYAGDVSGRSITEFVSSFDGASNTGTYVAMESFEGTLAGRSGTFNFWHSATMVAGERRNSLGFICPGTGTGDLAGITGTVELTIDDDDTHRFAFDWEIA